MRSMSIFILIVTGLQITACTWLSPDDTIKWKYASYEKPQALFPKAAFGYWDYEQNKNVYQANIENYVDEYKKRDLPLTGIVIEPCWQRDYNELIWNENYPDPE